MSFFCSNSKSRKRGRLKAKQLQMPIMGRPCLVLGSILFWCSIFTASSSFAGQSVSLKELLSGGRTGTLFFGGTPEEIGMNTDWDVGGLNWGGMQTPTKLLYDKNGRFAGLSITLIGANSDPFGTVAKHLEESVKGILWETRSWHQQRKGYSPWADVFWQPEGASGHNITRGAHGQAVISGGTLTVQATRINVPSTSQAPVIQRKRVQRQTSQSKSLSSREQGIEHLLKYGTFYGTQIGDSAPNTEPSARSGGKSFYPLGNISTTDGLVFSDAQLLAEKGAIIGTLLKTNTPADSETAVQKFTDLLGKPERPAPGRLSWDSLHFQVAASAKSLDETTIIVLKKNSPFNFPNYSDNHSSLPGCNLGPYTWDPDGAGDRGGRCRQYDGKYAKSRCCGR